MAHKEFLSEMWRARQMYSISLASWRRILEMSIMESRDFWLLDLGIWGGAVLGCVVGEVEVMEEGSIGDDGDGGRTPL